MKKHTRKNPPKKSSVSLKRLIEQFIEAANQLTQYRSQHGFNPGVAVIAKWHDQPSKNGVIADYGEMWRGVDQMSVPVIFADGHVQPWCIQDLTITKSRKG